jgi:hypothetical protein
MNVVIEKRVNVGEHRIPANHFVIDSLEQPFEAAARAFSPN